MLHFLDLADSVVVGTLRQQQNAGLAGVELCDLFLHIGSLCVLADTLGGSVDSCQELLHPHKFEVGPHENDYFVHRVVVVDLVPELSLKKLKPHVEVLLCFLDIQLKELLLQGFCFSSQLQGGVRDLRSDAPLPVMEV